MHSTAGGAAVTDRFIPAQFTLSPASLLVLSWPVIFSDVLLACRIILFNVLLTLPQSG